ncbi:MAG: transposase [Verrucomicrobiaceae bacterium]|nr:transposase [Verrucomicrobiaceae bacterium]
MKRKRHAAEEIIKKLRESAGLIAGGKTAEEAARHIGVSVPTYHRWREQYGGADQNTAKRLKELEKENSRLKTPVADQALDNAMLKELVEGAERSETDKGAAFARR